MVLRPSRDPLEWGSQDRLTATAGGETLEYFSQWFGPPQDSPDLVVLKFPGTAGRAERSTAFPITLMNDIAGLVLTWNPPGYGGSSGKASLSKIAAMANDFFSHVVDRHVPPSAALWLCGNSLGCATVLHLSSKCHHDKADSRKEIRSIDGLVMRNPPLLVPVVKHVAKAYPMGRCIKSVAESLIEEMNAELTAPRSTAPAVFLQSMADSVVPPSLQNQLIDCYAGPTRVVSMDGLDHDGIPTDEHEALMRESFEWLWQKNTDAGTSQQEAGN